MTEVTRIACPGCRRILLFKPEALDFPANCAACESRFSVDVYIRVSCPNCRQGSKVRESYRGRRVRCIRCHHDFISDRGIVPGDGGRLLVARMLDTDSPTPPESVQPFVQPGPTGLPQGPDVGPVTVSGSGIWQVSRSLEVERLRDEVQELRARLDREVASARRAAQEAEERRSSSEAQLAEALLELGETEQRTARLLSDCDEALHASGLERSALLSRMDRLNAAVASATAGVSEADRLAEEALRKLDEASGELRSERRRRLELGRVVEALKVELETIRDAQAADAAARIVLETSKRDAEELTGSLLAENRKLADEIGALKGEGGRLSEEIRQMAEDAERLRFEKDRLSDQVAHAGRSLTELEREAEAAVRLRQENRRLTVVIEEARSEAENLQSKLARELERAVDGSGPPRDDRPRTAAGPEPPALENGRHFEDEDRSGPETRASRKRVPAESPEG